MLCNNNLDNYSKAKEMIKDKLDIVLFVRNTILLDIICKTLIGDERNNIIKYLSIPVVSLKENFKNENEKNNIFDENTNRYIKYSKEDFQNLDNEIESLKEKEGDFDKKLYSYFQNQFNELKNLING